MATYLRLFPATTQFILKNGSLNVAGLLHIYLEGTDDLAPLYDTDGSQLPNPVMLDNDGRAPGLFVDSSKSYWMRVCDRYDGQIYTVRKMVPSGGGAGSALGNTYQVISSDGTVNVTEFVNAGTTTFDLSCDIDPEASKWGSAFSMRAALDGDDNWAEVQIITTNGSVTYQNGWAATKDCLGDIAAALGMTGSATATHTIDTKMVVTVDGTEVYTETGMLDPTESRGLVSFSWKGELAEGQKVDARIYVKTTETMSVGLAGRVFYNEECDGVVGGEGAAYVPGDGIDISGDVISVTGMQPVSGMSAYATQSAFDDCCSSVQSAISSLSSTVSGLTGTYVEISAISAESSVWNSASAISAITGDISSLSGDVSSLSGEVTAMSGNMSSYVPFSSLSGTTASAITSINGSAIGGVSLPIVIASGGSAKAIVNTGFIHSATTPLTSRPSLYVSASSTSEYPTVTVLGARNVETRVGDTGITIYSAEAGAVSSTSLVIDGQSIRSRRGGFSLSGRSGAGLYKSLLALAPHSTSPMNGSAILESDMNSATLYLYGGGWPASSIIRANVNSSTGPTILLSASGSSELVSIPSIHSWNAKLDASAIECTTASAVTSIGGSAIKGHEYSGVYPVVVDNTADTISIEETGLNVDDTMTAYTSAGELVIGVKSGLYAYESAMSSKLDTSAQVVTSIGVAAGALSSINGYGLSAGTANSAGTALYDSAGRTLTSMITNASASAIAAVYAASAVSSVSGDYYPMTGNPSAFLVSSILGTGEI